MPLEGRYLQNSTYHQLSASYVSANKPSNFTCITLCNLHKNAMLPSPRRSKQKFKALVLILGDSPQGTFIWQRPDMFLTVHSLGEGAPGIQ